MISLPLVEELAEAGRALEAILRAGKQWDVRAK